MLCPLCELYDLTLKTGQTVAAGPVVFVCPYDGFELERIMHSDPGWPRKP
jgi:hypothetical protein